MRTAGALRISRTAAHRGAPKTAHFRCGCWSTFSEWWTTGAVSQTDLPSRAEPIRRMVELAAKMKTKTDADC